MSDKPSYRSKATGVVFGYHPSYAFLDDMEEVATEPEPEPEPEGVVLDEDYTPKAPPAPVPRARARK